MIYDCFTYAGEKHLVEIQLDEFKKLDVVHICVQATKTFTNIDRELTFPDFNERLTHVVVRDMPEGGDTWNREKWQRNCILRGLELKYPRDEDLVIIRDADEIVFSDAVKKYQRDWNTAALVMCKFGYYLNCIEGRQSWKIAKILTYGRLKNFTPDQVRNMGAETEIANAGHHYSYLGGVEAMMNKLNSFSHAYDEGIVNLKNNGNLKHKYETGESLWGNDKWEFVPIDESYPEYVQKHQHDSLKHLIKQL